MIPFFTDLLYDKDTFVGSVVVLVALIVAGYTAHFTIRAE